MDRKNISPPEAVTVLPSILLCPWAREMQSMYMLCLHSGYWECPENSKKKKKKKKKKKNR